MKFDPQKHHRQSIRLQGYDYSKSGFYFVTLCTYQKQCWFGDIKDGIMRLNQIGELVRDEWLKSSEIRQEIELDEWIIMPNHLHGIVIIINNQQCRGKGCSPKSQISQPQKPKSLTSLIGGFKASVTKKINQLCNFQNPPIWQRNYYESIIKDEKHLNQVREYIENNPLEWLKDTENPDNNDQFQYLLFDIPF